MKSVIYSIFILATCLATFSVQAQEPSTTTFAKYPLKVAVGNHSVGFPLENLFANFNPHIAVGTEKALNKNTRHKVFLASNLAYIFNNVIGNTITWDADLGYRFTSKQHIYTDIALGPGMLDQFHPAAIYQQNDDGTYTKASDKGRVTSLIGLNLGLGYDLSQKSKLPIALGISHNFFLQTSYFDVASFPIMPQSTTNILLTYKFKKS